MRIMEIGVGAVGMGLASAIAAAGAAIDLVARPGILGALRAWGLRRVGVLGEVWIPPEVLRVYPSVAVPPRQVCDFILASTKAYDAEDVACQLSACPWLFNEQTRIVLFLNGVGGAEIFAEYFPRESIYAARLMTGFELLNPAAVKITVHGGPIAIGNPFTGDAEAVRPLCALLSAGGLPAAPCSRILEEISAKLLFNCSCNALGALCDLPIGGLAADNDLRHIMEQIIFEAHAMMKRAGYRTYWKRATDYLAVFYQRLIPATADHRTSMSHDLRAGKRTEIDFLNGRIVSWGHRFGVPAPVNRLITQAIKRLEARSLPDSFCTPDQTSITSATGIHTDRVNPASDGSR